MSEKPILFSGEMVRAILAGRKTQTRRVMKPQPSANFSPVAVDFYSPIVLDKYGFEDAGPEIFGVYGDDEGYRFPYGQPGDHLWVRETWRCEERGEYGIDGVHYRADDAFIEIENTYEAAEAWWNAKREGDPWRPSIFMPRWASRITLEIVRVRVERVQNITDLEAFSEGVWLGGTAARDLNHPEPMKDLFIDLWDKINSRRGFGWNVNPWVWVIEFNVVEVKHG